MRDLGSYVTGQMVIVAKPQPDREVSSQECSRMYTIMLIDDQPAMLSGMATLVENTGIAKVIATETDAAAAVATALDKKPDLILLDVSLGQVSGVDVARNIISQWSGAKVLAVSAHANAVYVRSMLNAGASGYMLKDNGPKEIANAITTIMDGGQWIGTGLDVSPG